MGSLLIVPIAIIILTYKFINAIQIKEAPKANNLMAWTFYLTGVIGLIGMNVVG